jgi:subtilisin family serine protease
MKKQIFFSLLLSYCLTSFSQEPQKYWVYFRDKSHTPYSIDKPLEFLSFKAVERRMLQGIAINESDLPIDPNYVQALADKGVGISNLCKWMNAVSIATDNLAVIEAIKSLAFVAQVRPVMRMIDPSRGLAKEKFEPIMSVDFPAFSASKYGASLNQIKMIGIDTLHALGYTGKGIDIAVFDGGFINVDQINFFQIAQNEHRIHPVWNYVDRDTNVYTRSYHGTAVMSVMCANLSGTMIGAAPDANYYLFITEDVAHETRVEEDNWAAAAEKADSIGMMIFSTSLGYTEFNDIATNHTYGEMNGDSTVITRAANMAASKGILVVNSAGNEGNSSWHYISAPADGDSVLCIGAVDPNRVLANFSSRGPNSSGHLKPNVCGNGAKIYVATVNSDISTSDGTSFSCPLIAASAACLWQAFPEKRSMEIFHAIEQCSDRYSTPDNDYGFGIPDFFVAFKKYEASTHDNPLEVFPKVLPTLFNHSFVVLWKNAEDATVTFSLYDDKGAMLSSQKQFLVKNEVQKIYFSDMADYQAGIYLLKVSNAKKESTFRLMKY